jgi:potassium uptake TrkH family protein
MSALFTTAQVERLSHRLGILMRFVALLAIISLISEYGFYVSPETVVWLHRLDLLIIALFALELLLKAFVHWKKPRFWRSHAVQVILVALFGLQFMFLRHILQFAPVASFLEFINLVSLTKVYIIVAQAYLLALLLVRAIQGPGTVSILNITPVQLLVFSYLFMIFLGTILLILPRSHAQAGGVSFLDALFTATSGVCVTGLITVDTATAWTPLGKFFILGLFQIGGLGLMTYTAAFALLLGQGLGMRQTALMQDVLSVQALGKIGRLLIAIIGITFLAEVLGTVLLFGGWRNELGTVKALTFSIFHAVSAFCNAGFSLFSENLAGSRTNTGIVITMALLIFVGGLGFAVLLEVFDPRRWTGLRGGNKPHFSLQAKIVIWVSLGLVVFGALWIYLFEALPATGVWHAGVLDALFQSITSRTAGFNTVDISEYRLPTRMLLMVLMLIGASPGSTGGGVKTVTAALILISVWCTWRGKPHTEAGRRRIPERTVRNAFLIVLLYLTVVVVCSLGLTVTEDASLEVVLFEELSAMGTVGLSLGLTPHLSSAGKCIIILSMLVGRIGPLTFLLALGRRAIGDKYSYPEENVVLG